jgi:hypothetical protein
MVNWYHNFESSSRTPWLKRLWIVPAEMNDVIAFTGNQTWKPWKHWSVLIMLSQPNHASLWKCNTVSENAIAWDFWNTKLTDAEWLIFFCERMIQCSNFQQPIYIWYHNISISEYFCGVRVHRWGNKTASKRFDLFQGTVLTWDTFRLAEFFAGNRTRVFQNFGWFGCSQKLNGTTQISTLQLATVQAQIAPLLDGSDDDTAVTMGIGESLPKSLESRNQEVVFKYVTGWWWLETWNFNFSISWKCHHPKWRAYFSEGLKPPTRQRCMSKASHDSADSRWNPPLKSHPTICSNLSRPNFFYRSNTQPLGSFWGKTLGRTYPSLSSLFMFYQHLRSQNSWVRCWFLSAIQPG